MFAYIIIECMLGSISPGPVARSREQGSSFGFRSRRFERRNSTATLKETDSQLMDGLLLLH